MLSKYFPQFEHEAGFIRIIGNNLILLFGISRQESSYSTSPFITDPHDEHVGLNIIAAILYPFRFKDSPMINKLFQRPVLPTDEKSPVYRFGFCSKPHFEKFAFRSFVFGYAVDLFALFVFW